MLCWIECACCVCDPSMHLSVPSIGFVYCLCMSEFISPFKGLRAGSQVFALLILFYVILHTMWSGKSLQSIALHLALVCCACLPSV